MKKEMLCKSFKLEQRSCKLYAKIVSFFFFSYRFVSSFWNNCFFDNPHFPNKILKHKVFFEEFQTFESFWCTKMKTYAWIGLLIKHFLPKFIFNLFHHLQSKLSFKFLDGKICTKLKIRVCSTYISS